jgi:PAS domain S-box-containing protein
MRRLSMSSARTACAAALEWFVRCRSSCIMLVGIGLLVMLMTSTAWGQSDRRVVVCRGDFQYPPYEFIDVSGRPTGFNVEMLRAVCRVSGLRCQIDLGPWNEVRRDLEEGRIDILTGMYRTAERDEVVDFTPPLTVVHHALVVRDGSPIRSLDDLAGHELIVQSGDVMHDFAKARQLTDRIIPVESPVDGLRLLAAGEHDAALFAHMQARYYMAEFDLTNLAVAGGPFYPRPYCFAVQEGDTELRELLTQGLAIVKSTGEYDAIRERWFGVYDDPDVITAAQAMRYALWIGGPVVLLLGAVVMWSWTLRRLVSERTAQLRAQLATTREVADALHENERRLTTLMGNLPGMAYRGELDDDRSMTFVSDGAIELLGRDPEAMVEAGGLMYGHMVHEDDRTNMLDAMRLAVREQQPFELVYRVRVEPGEEKWVSERGQGVFDEHGDLIAIEGFISDITRLKEAEEEARRHAAAERLLLQELDHRVRNNLASLMALIDLTSMSTEDVAKFAAALRTRTEIIATMHGLLSQQGSRPIGLAKLLELLLATDHEGRIRIDGPDLALTAKQAQAIGMVANELLTNSQKYGALTRPAGQVAVSWRVVDGDAPWRQVFMNWRESGGPRIEGEVGRGTGSGLIEGITRSELRGEAELRYPAEGVHHTLTMRLERPAGLNGDGVVGQVPAESSLVEG